MASNHPTQSQPAKDSAQEEERLEDALYHLNQLHLQLRRLRSALPRMLEPLNTKQPSPEAMYSAFMQSVDSTTKELGSFRDALASREIRTILAKANESQKRDPKGIKQWRAMDDPFWADPDRKRVKTE
ncbi:hypothetical protein B0T21DRAFT_374990 [Apiosordaria backusii]|uniref:Mediator of RNA polymerase II transcription subunit 8 n=1 Tax=Apiosordaria backusii TaxID=314023 RepID=A0AA40DWS6_9PEZI|nr:hypothetical protein B0T21DRAFT_374990 [Apiosordaria backusii]